MQEPWMDRFVASLPAPEADAELVTRVQSQMRQLLAKEAKANSNETLIYHILWMTLATVPIFLGINYLYYTILERTLTSLAPQVMPFFAVIFALFVSFFGALCYGSVPIWTAYWLKNGEKIGV